MEANMNSIYSSIRLSPLVAFFIFTFVLEGIAILLFSGNATILPFALVLILTVAAVSAPATAHGVAGLIASLNLQGCSLTEI
jgi:hypothetical protein